jgi:hypothetical protein
MELENSLSARPKLMVDSEKYHLSDLEGLLDTLESKEQLALIPLAPLHQILTNSPPELVGQVLPYLPPQKRQALLDLDIWFRDELNITQCHFWVSSYNYCENDDVKTQFAFSDTFQLYLKGVFNIATFDVEDPQYPEHDNYFLTDDNLLLFEFHENFPLIKEVKSLINLLYFEMGVENAYAHLMKTISESFLISIEEEFQKRKNRLETLGFPDYLGALSYQQSFSSIKLLNFFINERINFDVKKPSPKLESNGPLTPNEIPLDQLQQVLPGSSYAPWLNLLKLMEQLPSIQRQEFLRVDLVKLMNALILNQMYTKDNLSDFSDLGESEGESENENRTNLSRSPSKDQNKKSTEVRNGVNLGIEYVKGLRKNPNIEDSEILMLFSFSDLYKIGLSLIDNGKKIIKKVYVKFDDAAFEEFLGERLAGIIEKTIKIQPLSFIASESDFENWVNDIDYAVKIYPFIKALEKTLRDLQKTGIYTESTDQAFINYTFDTLNFENLMITNFINFSLGKIKMGVTVTDFFNFLKLHTTTLDLGKSFLKSPDDKALITQLIAFKDKFGLGVVPGFEMELYDSLVRHLDGVDYFSITSEDYKYLGGPILINEPKIH